MKRLLFLLVALPLLAQESFHRAEQDREIRYWLLDPATHQFRISHDFTVTRAGQASVHSFVRKGSVVAPDATMIDLDSGKKLVIETTREVNGATITTKEERTLSADGKEMTVETTTNTPNGEQKRKTVFTKS